MNYDFHVRFTDYLNRLNAGRLDAYTEEEDHAAALLWDAQIVSETAELDGMARVAWAHDLSVHPELRKKRKVRRKAAGL